MQLQHLQATITSAVAIVGSYFGGNGIRRKGEQYAVAKKAVENTQNVLKSASKGFARKTAQKAAKAALSAMENKYWSVSLKQLGLAVGFGAFGSHMSVLYGKGKIY